MAFDDHDRFGDGLLGVVVVCLRHESHVASHGELKTLHFTGDIRSVEKVLRPAFVRRNKAFRFSATQLGDETEVVGFRDLWSGFGVT